MLNNDLAWAERQAAELNTLFLRCGITVQIAAAELLRCEQSYCAITGASQAASWAAREESMKESPAARAAAMLRGEGVTGPDRATAASAARRTSEAGAVAARSEPSDESTAAKIANVELSGGDTPQHRQHVRDMGGAEIPAEYATRPVGDVAAAVNIVAEREPDPAKTEETKC